MPKTSPALSIILCLLIYLPTIVYVPIGLFMVAAGISIYLCKDYLVSFFTSAIKFKIVDRNFAILILIAIIAMVLRISQFANHTSIGDMYSFVFLFPFTYILGKVVFENPKIYKFLLLCIAVESLVAIAEYFYGASTFFVGTENYRAFESYDLLYFTRVFGLSPNSSAFALKLFFAIVFLPLARFNKKQAFLLELLFVIASIFAFGRIILAALIFFYLLKLFKIIIQEKKQGLFSLKTVPAILLILFFSINPSWSKQQFTRNNTVANLESHATEDEVLPQDRIVMDELEEKGRIYTTKVGLDKVEMSGRNYIWNVYVAYIFESPLFGNYGKKLMFGRFHAHNSFIEFFASCGLILFLLLMILIGVNINIENWIYIFPILLLAFGQYLVFWGISFFDILFYSVLFFLKPIKNEN